MKYRDLVILLPLLFTLNVSSRPAIEETKGPVDYHYNDTHSGTKLCVFCLKKDLDRNGVVEQCKEKYREGVIFSESVEWHPKKFYPLCDTLQNDRYPRYVKNCTAPPEFPDVEVTCSIQNGLPLVRVHDTCQVKCTEARMSPVNPVTLCDPVTSNWTSVSCRYHSCAPLEKSVIIEENEGSSCNRSTEQPLNTSCEVTCPLGYDPPVRVMECQEGDWKLVSRCAPLPTRLPDEKSWLIPLSVCLGAVAVVIIGLLVYCVWRRRKDDGSDSSVTTENQKEVDDAQEKNSLIGSSVSGESVLKHQTNAAAEHKEIHDSDESLASRPPKYTSCCGEGFEMDKLLGADAACRLEFFYKINDKMPEESITQSGVRLARGTLLTVLARCKNGHPITQFNYGPFFKNDNYRLFGYGVTVVIAGGDEGMYILAAQCTNGGQDMSDLSIQITDVTGNPEHTEPKYREPSVDLDSLDRSVTHLPIIAASEPSQSLKASPDSLPSDPDLAALLMESDTDHRSSENQRGRGSRGAGSNAPGDARGQHMKIPNSSVSLVRQESNPENHDADDCTLPLVTLRNDRLLKESLDKLCLLLEPLSDRQPDLTIQGLIFHTLGYSLEKIEHIIWAKREDLRNSPARVLLMMMMQAGKKASDVVCYFSKHQHHHTTVVETLQLIPAHRSCPVCQKYS